METSDDLVLWAEANKIHLDGIKPERIPGRGWGFVATRELEEGGIVLQIPLEFAHHSKHVPQPILQHLPSASDHCKLAVEVAYTLRNKKRERWCFLPTPRPELETSIPMLWPLSLQAHLPSQARRLVSEQFSRFLDDWKDASRAFPKLKWAEFQYAWVIVNTRAYSYVPPEIEEAMSEHTNPEGNLALLPLADLFNHGDQGCTVSQQEKHYEFITKGKYAKGQEVYSCYGDFSNDELLVDYGFVLENNPKDLIWLDEVIFRNVSDFQKRLLQEQNAWGEYVLHADNTVCARTKIALRLLCCDNHEEWLRSLENPEETENPDPEADDMLRRLLDQFVPLIRKTLECIQGLESSSKTSYPSLKRRWDQIRMKVEETSKALQRR